MLHSHGRKPKKSQLLARQVREPGAFSVFAAAAEHTFCRGGRAQFLLRGPAIFFPWKPNTTRELDFKKNLGRSIRERYFSENAVMLHRELNLGQEMSDAMGCI